MLEGGLVLLLTFTKLEKMIEKKEYPKNLRSHKDFSVNKKSYKERFYGYFFLGCGFWDIRHNNYNDYIIKVKCEVKGVYTPLNRGYDDFCIRQTGKYFGGNHSFNGGNSTHIFRNREECYNYRKEYFIKNYKKYLEEQLDQRLKRQYNNIEIGNKKIESILSDISEFKKIVPMG